MLRTLIVAALAAGVVSAHAATFTVTNLNDAGAGSLRDAVVQANADPGPDTVDFAVEGTIVLTSGPITIGQALTIQGPGPTKLTIDGNANGRIFQIVEVNSPACPELTGPTDYLVTISGLTLRNGRRSVVNSSGGAIVSLKSLNLDNVTVRGSTAKRGGGVSFLLQHPGQTLSIANSRIIDNISQEIAAGNTGIVSGGGLLVIENCSGTRTMPATVNISGSQFLDNAARPTTLGGQGGAIATYSDADITVTDTRFIGNRVVIPTAPAAGTSFLGGGVYGRARSVTIVRSEFASNTADLGSAMGFYNDLLDLQDPSEAVDVKLVNTTVAGNTADTSITILGYANVAFQLFNSTVARNRALPTRTGGIGFNSGPTVPASASNALPPTLTIASTILWNPGPSGDQVDIAKNNTNIPGTLTVAATNSLVGAICGSECGTINLSGAGNKTGQDPLLDPLAFNGGPTRTAALRAGSPAINAGSNPQGLATDQRGAGFARVVGAAADMGACESGNTVPPPATFTVTNLNNSGDGSLRNAVSQANQTPGSQKIDFAPGLTGTIALTSGQIAINDGVTIQGPGADKITVDGGLLNRVFSIFEDATDVCLTPGEDFPVSISGLTLTRGQRNVQNNPGGALYSEKSLTLDSVVISASVAARGGGLGFQTLYPGQSLTVRNSSVVDNVARPIAGSTVGNNGGGLMVRERCGSVTAGVTLNIADSVFQGNRTEPTDNSSAGAGIYAETRNTLTLTDSRIVGNTIVAQNPSVPTQNNRGGGMSVESAAAVRIERSEIAGNSADRAAGVRLVVQDPALQTSGTAMQAEIVNSTIAGNVATTPVRAAGGVGVYGNVALKIDNSTIAGNSAPSDAAGGIIVDAGVTSPAGGNTAIPAVALRSSIVADSQNGAPDIGVYDETVITAFTVNATNSLIGAVEPIVTVSGSGNLQGVNPMLGALAFNGGPTRTRALQAGSPAINAGSNPLGLTTDQRGTGFPRVAGAAADMGAYEFSGTATAPVVQGRVARKVHGSAGTFGLPLNADTATPTTEPRSGGPSGNHTIVFIFDKEVTGGNASITAGPGTAGTPTFSGNEMRVPLSGVTNQQYVTVAVSDVVAADGGTGGAGAVRVGFLLGDVSQNRVVTVSDLAQVNAQIAQVVTVSNYLKDVNASGTLTVADKGIANTQITKALPTP